MSKGGYNGGSTVIGPNSGWFTNELSEREKLLRPVTATQLVQSASAAADRAEKRRAKIEELQASPEAAKKAAVARARRRKKRQG